MDFHVISSMAPEEVPIYLVDLFNSFLRKVDNSHVVVGDCIRSSRDKLSSTSKGDEVLFPSLQFLVEFVDDVIKIICRVFWF